MILRKMIALLYEIWLRNRFGLTLVALLLPLCTVVYPMLGADLLHNLGQGPAILPMAGSLVFVVIAFSHGDLAGFPEHTYLLPARTRLLTLTPMLLGASLVVLWYMLWVLLVLRPAGFDLNLLWPMLIIATCCLWMQTSSWAFGHRPMVAAVMLGVMIMLILALGAFASGMLEIPPPIPGPLVKGVFLMLAL